MTDVEVLDKVVFSAIDLLYSAFLSEYARRADVGDGRHSGLRGTAGGRCRCAAAATSRRIQIRTLIPSWEKHGATAELSSSASLRRMGNFSTADMGMSPR